MTRTKLEFWEQVYVEFVRNSNGLYTYRISQESYSNMNPVEPIGHRHYEVVHNATIDRLRLVFKQYYHNSYLYHIYIRKRKNGRIVIIYRYNMPNTIFEGEAS